MYRPYAIRPPWEMRRAALAAAKCYKGGTNSEPSIPPEFRPLIDASIRSMVGEQGYNPISAYNQANPMQVQGLTPSQMEAMGMTLGASQTSPLQFLAAQAAQRAAGMSGAGPTTGSYDPSGEMGLQDWAQLMNPYFANGGEMGQQVPSQTGLQAAQGGNATPQTPPGTNYAGGPPNMSLPPPGAGSTSTSGSGGPGSQNQGALGGSNGRQQFGPQIHGLPGQNLAMPASGPGPSASGPAWTGNEAVAYEHGGGMDPYYDAMTTPAMRRAMAAQYTGPAFAAGQNGLPTFNGFQYTGADHEEGGNPALAKFAHDNGLSPEAFAALIEQGSQAQRAYSTNPQNIASHLAQGQDVWGNQMPQTQSNFMQNLANNRAAMGMGNAGMAGHQANGPGVPGTPPSATPVPRQAPKPVTGDRSTQTLAARAK